MTLFQALVLGLLQGVTELFPISSLGHSVLLPPLLGWRFDEGDSSFLLFLVATHCATALVLFFFFWRDWMRIIGGMFHSLREREITAQNSYGKIGWILVVGTLPAGVVGLLFQDWLKTLFATPRFAAVFLFGNGLLLLGAEVLRRRRLQSEAHDDARIAGLSWKDAFLIGCMQALALMPGFSRTGASLSGGLLRGLSHEDAARFAFLLATPIIFAAGALKLPELLVNVGTAVPVILGSASAAAGAYFSVRFLTRYFKTNTLLPFAIYCILIGALAEFLLR